MDNISEICDNFFCNDVYIDYSKPEYDNVNTEKLFNRHVRPLLEQDNPHVPMKFVTLLLHAKWVEFNRIKAQQMIFQAKMEQECIANQPLQICIDMSHLYRTKRLCDITFMVGNFEFPAHKAIIAARSPVFLAMFESGMNEATTNHVTIYDVDHEAFNRFLLFIYSGKVVLKDHAEDLLILADKYAMPDLHNLCETHLALRLNVNNVARIFITADLIGAVTLKSAAVGFIKENMDAVRVTEDWRLAKIEHPGRLVGAFL